MTQRLYMGSGILCCMLKMKTKSNTDRQFLCQFRLLPHTQLSHIQINIQEVSLSSCYQKNYPGGQLSFIVITLHGLQSLLNCTTSDRFASKPHLNTINVKSCFCCWAAASAGLGHHHILLSDPYQHGLIYVSHAYINTCIWWLCCQMPDFICELFLSSYSLNRFRCMNSGPLVEELFQWSLPIVNYFSTSKHY